MIGVVGDETGAVTAALEAGGTPWRTGAPASVLGADPDAIVAVGTSAVTGLVGGDRVPDVPILAVDAGDGFPVTDEVAASVAALRAGRYTTVDNPVFRVSVAGDHAGYAVLDAMVVTSDPGRISEYRVASDAELGTVRADGVAVATPAGSHGYARSAGGPLLRPGSAAIAVVPVAAFTMSPDRWVVDLEETVEIAGKRDVPVSLLVDDERREIRPNRPVTVTASDSISLVVPDGAE